MLVKPFYDPTHYVCRLPQASAEELPVGSDLHLTPDRRGGTLWCSMTKARATRAKPRRMTIDEFDRDLPRALAAARQPGGVLVVDADGNTRFHMSIPHTTLR